MKIIENLIQGSYEWHEFRRTHLGASNSAAILGMSPYKSAFYVWEEKTNRSFPEQMNENMQAGVNAEPIIRTKWESHTGKKYETPTAEHDDYPFLSASYDCYCSEDGSIAEIKSSKYPKLANCIKTQDLEYFKEIYPEYNIQCQHLMMISDTKECPIVTISPEGELLSITIPRDNDFIEQKMLPELLVFWNEYICKDKGPPLSDKDFLYVSDVDAIMDAKKLTCVTDQIKTLQEQEKILRKRLIERAGDNSAVFGDEIKVTRYTSSRIDYRKACEDNEIDTSPYKKMSTPSYRFTPIAKK